ncbi:lipoprotein-releasing ABC transporter permease subunit [Oceanomicrobium pacificus]|uniref:Lipoprotein-releasing ABC transporter permease subunit n=1 Tax=Oceanomicrobium pacificus TaxID=2692916 RepID=A0A6B0TLI8_9RHOB|nr:lipoprotein-releasing ABC transporter permease subunit [Oceanomicrobium pacificus]MXU65377.1 lipoprotein-releasing ABC transporter permease subunit [Oceanomicrobium pacificus]
MAATRPFAGFEWAIAWRYLRARRKDGGISVIAWYALIGVMLGVGTLIVVQAVMYGFREEFTDRILGANAHVTVYSALYEDANGNRSRAITDYDDLTARVAAVPGVTRAAPIIRGQVMASGNERNAGVEVYGERPEDMQTLPLIANPETAEGDLSRFPEGIAVGQGVARELGLRVGDFITLISPNGVKTAFGTAPRINDYEVVYIFSVGRYDIDRTRVYLPFDEAQSYFDREGTADEIEVLVQSPQEVDQYYLPIIEAAGGQNLVWTWKDASGAFLSALDVERRVMFIILSLVVLIAAMNIISGLVMLVKNKGRDIGILRTMGLSQGSILRIFFICGSMIGVIGTFLGVILGCLFAYYIQDIQALVEWISGGQVWDPEIRFLTEIPARLRWQDVSAAMLMALGLSFVITIFPARAAARMNPVEALRYE